MKAFAKRQRPPASPQVARKVMPGRGVRSDGALEEQAQRAADQALRGVLTPGVLTAAPTAHVDLPDSPGQALPDELRRAAESAFRADLSAVRVHRDPVAASAVAREGAHAFTAGRDIYFAETEWRPTTVAGRALVYHELAHVLQQTSTDETPGRLRAQPRSGLGNPQAQSRRGGRNG